MLRHSDISLVSAASAFHVGGGFLSGGRHALEEALCTQSTLFSSLRQAWEQQKQGTKDATAKTGSKFRYIPMDGVIVSPKVDFFRLGSDEGYKFIERPPQLAAVISVAAFNKKNWASDAPVDAPSDPAEYERLMRLKFQSLLLAASEARSTTIIMPDVGCGVYGNDPKDVGRIFGDVLRNGPYWGHFQEVVLVGRDEFKDAVEALVKNHEKQPQKSEQPEYANLQQHVSNVKLNQSEARLPETSLSPSAANLNLSLIPEPCTDAISFADPRPDRSGRDVGVIAFYFPGHDEAWDALCGSSFLGNFWDLRPTGGMELEAPCQPGVRHSFTNAEAAFQALKFWSRADEFAKISANQAFRKKMELKGSEDFSYGGYGSNWSGMVSVLMQKFKKHSPLAEALLQTGDTYLLEHNAISGRDRIWSNNGDGEGSNWLGLQLMLVRGKLNGDSGQGSWTQYIKDMIDLRNGKPTGGSEWQQVVRNATQALLHVLPEAAPKTRRR